jgi:Icc-related predicted phosphoesterase
MKILILSDLHLEFGKFSPVHQQFRIDDGVDVVVLAGDIAEGVQGVRWARETFITKEIIYVAGNHEFYGGHLEFMQEQLRSVARSMGVHFLECDSVELDGICFLGTTLWTDFEFFGEHQKQAVMWEVQTRMNDYRCIHTSIAHPGAIPDQVPRLLVPGNTARLHRESVSWLEAGLAGRDPGKTVVVTHHAPHRNSVHLRFARDLMTGAYVTDLSRLMGRSALWIHGHMHDSADYVINGSRVICNPRGYQYRDGRTENERFNPFCVIEIQEV